MKFVSIVLATLLVFMFQSSFVLPTDRKVDVTAVIEELQALTQRLESDSDVKVVDEQTYTRGSIFELQLLLKDLINAISSLSQSMTSLRRCECG